MATMQPDSPMEEAQEPAGMNEAAEGESDGTFYIEIAVHPDGTFTVGKEGSSYETAEEQGAEAAGETKEPGKDYQDVKSAMTAVLALIKGSEPVDQAGEKKAFAQGFAG